MWAGAESSLVRTVTASAIGGSRSAPVGSLGEAVDAGSEHVDTTERVQREVLDPERAEHPRGPVDGGRDVVQLEVEEHLVAEVSERTDGVGAGGAVELEADLHDAEPGPQRCRQPVGLDEVVEIEQRARAAGGPRRGRLRR